jgi:hypothetical protein
MRGFLLGLSISLAFIAGCVAGSSRLLVPPARASNTYVVEQRWEYFCFAEDRAEKVNERANAAGVRGWELVTASTPTDGDPIWCFRLPRP